MKRFSDIIFEAGISAPVRTPRGRDIAAACGHQMLACGQLKSLRRRVRRAAPSSTLPAARPSHLEFRAAAGSLLQRHHRFETCCAAGPGVKRRRSVPRGTVG
jgi:hypothetical protein